MAIEVNEKYKGYCVYSGITLIVLGLFLFSPNITGNVIGDMEIESTNTLGSFLLLFGFVLGFFSKRVLLLMGIFLAMFKGKR